MESLYCGGSSGGNNNNNNGISKQQQISSPILKREEDIQLLDEDIDDDNRDDRVDDKEEEAYVKAKQNGFVVDHKEKNNKPFDYYLDSASRSSLENVDQENELDNVNNARNIPRRMSKINNNNNNNTNNNSNNNSITSGSYQRRQSKNFNYSPDTTDYDSESSMRFITSDYPTNIPKMIHTATNVSSASAAAMVEMSGGPIVNCSSSSYAKYCTSMPVLEDGLSSGHASDNENNNPIPSSNDFYNKRNSSSIASSSTISTIQKQYQENLVQTHANNNIFYTNNNNTSSSNSNNTSHGMVKSSSGNNNSGVLLNNGDLEQPPSKVRSAQSPLNYHPYYAMRYDTTPSTATSTATIKEPSSSSTSLRYDGVSSINSNNNNNNNGIGGANNNKELTTSRYENGKELLNTSSTHGGLLSNNKIFKNRDPELESLYTISK